MLTVKFILFHVGNTKQVRGKRGAEDRKRTQSDRTQYKRRLRQAAWVVETLQKKKMFVGNMQANKTQDLTKLPVRG